jgi:hypothetical protein
MQTSLVYNIDSEKLNDALAILDKELEVFNSLVQIDQKFAPRIRFAIFAFFLGLAMILMLRAHHLISFMIGWVLAAGFFLGYLLVLTIVLFKEFPAYKLLRRTQRNLGLAPEKLIRFVGWKEAKARLLPVILKLLLDIIAAAIIVASYLTENFNPWIFDFGILLLALTESIFFDFVTRRNLLLMQHRLESAKQLESTLLSQQKSQPETQGQLTISIPESEYKDIARIERALVNLDRQRAIKRTAKKGRTTALAVQQSASVLKAKSELEPSVRIRVQTRIDELSTNPAPTDSRHTPNGDWRLPVAETFWEISYAVAEDPPRILVQDLLPSGQPERQYQEK